jgi:hypothetical protein
MPEYDHVITIECDGAKHKLGVRERPSLDVLADLVLSGRWKVALKYDVDVLDHDAEMVTGFVAFGAEPPLCTKVAPYIAWALTEYEDIEPWWDVEWPTSIGSAGLDINGMSVRDIEDELETAKAEEDRRTAPLSAKFRQLMARIEREKDPEVKHDLEQRADDVWNEMDEESQYVSAWEEALDYAKDVERYAMASSQKAHQAHEALLAGDFKVAYHRAYQAGQLARKGDNPGHWDKFIRALRELKDVAR